MNDKILLDNYLLLLKATTEVYVHGTIESSNDKVRSILKLGLDETLKHQARVYDEMVSYDYYIVNNIDPNEIENKLNSLIEED